jgi:hypothetical protein
MMPRETLEHSSAIFKHGNALPAVHKGTSFSPVRIVPLKLNSPVFFFEALEIHIQMISPGYCQIPSIYSSGSPKTMAFQIHIFGILQ